MWIKIGQLSNPVEVKLKSESQYAAFPHFVTWIDDSTAITSTQQLGPTSFTPDNAKIIGPSVWLIDTNKIGSDTEYPTEDSATMIILQPKVQMVMEFINLHQIPQ